MFKESGVADYDEYSAHSLQRGFTAWASDNGWDLRTLVKYVGWKNVQTAMRYVDAKDQHKSELRQVLTGRHIGRPLELEAAYKSILLIAFSYGESR
ncbi:tyrosine-type recombinase/integrase [Undibacterium sp. Ji83W]|uniref:tyrosine-type recombinase/integrase n=1 Tax=Undibacterium sp. Ji83W TaxID=3413043 RepID=UPI003BF13DA3